MREVKAEVDVIRASFVARFGEEEAARVEDAAQAHYAEDEALMVGVLAHTTHGNDDFGSSPFRYWFLLAIARQCVSVYREGHGIQATEEDLRNWAIAEGHLAQHDGSVPDFVAMLIGHYNPWLNPQEVLDA